MNKKILLTAFTLTAILLATSYVGMAYAKTPADIIFSAPMDTFGITSYEFIQAGKSNTWISYGITYGTVIDGIVGSWTAEAHWIHHDWVGPILNPDMSEMGGSTGGATLTIDPATVEGKTGTIVLKFTTCGNGDGGNWVLKDGTGELEGLHGQGTWVTDFFEQVFEGKIHFDP